MNWKAFSDDLKGAFKSQTECARITDLHYGVVHRAWNEQEIRLPAFLRLCHFAKLDPIDYYCPAQ